MHNKLDGIFKPKTIAVVGASRREGTVGNAIFRNLLFSEFTGRLFPVNPKTDSVMGVYAYSSLAEIPSAVDLAVLVVPAQAILNLVDDAIAKGVKALVCISAGFKEVGAEGAALEGQLRDKVRAAGIPLIGPNCLGVINTDPDVHMNATFARKMPASGNLAFVLQSGALCTSVLDYAEQRQIGFSQFISFGNKADVSEIDILEYLSHDEKTSVIAMYLEDITDGRRFIETVRSIFWKSGKPMLCLKSGRSPEGAKAVSSHTGSLAGSDSIYDALLLQAGVQRVDTISELFDCAALYTTQPLPNGDRVAIVTNAGGPGIMAVDAAVRHGLRIAEFSSETTAKLRGALPPTAPVTNPVDVIGDARADRYQAAIRTVLEDKNVDIGVVILTPQSMTEIPETAALVPEAVKGINKPVVCSFMGGDDVEPGAELLRSMNIPNYGFPEDAIRALSSASRLAMRREVPRRELPTFDDLDIDGAKKIIADALESHDERYLTQAQCRPLMACYRLPVLRSEVVQTAEDAAHAAERMGKPVVMKVMSADVVHKHDAGGVILDIRGTQQARDAYHKICANVENAVPGARIQGILVEEEAAKGVEVIVGANRDERFGPLVMFGLGGILVEVLKDVSFRLAPMWRSSAERMIRQIRSFEVLDGFRGSPPSDIPAIENVLLRVSAMACNHPEIVELDINPLIVHAQGRGASVADGRMMLRRQKSWPYLKPTLLIALGGNALIQKGQLGTIDEQFANLTVPLRQVARLSRQFRIILTHGNGPQVGNLMLQQERCAKVPSLPLEILVAQTQGQIGYMIESTLDAELGALGLDKIQRFVSLLSYVVVDENDPAFQQPSKPIGPTYKKSQVATLPFPVAKTAKGYRRIVASPRPITIVEKHEIKQLIAMDFIVICCGGGGIPVIREGRSFSGVNAVIDKDLSSAKLAEEVGVDQFIIVTDRPGVFLDFGQPNQRYVHTMTATEAETHLAQGQFPPGSMGPKVEAAVNFVRRVGKRAVITSVDAIETAVDGKAGTTVTAG